MIRQENYRLIFVMIIVFTGWIGFHSFAFNTVPTDTAKARDYYRQAADYLENGNEKMAIWCLNQSVKEDDEFIEAHNQLSLLYSKAAVYDSAMVHCYRSIELNKNGEQPHKLLAIIYGIKEELDSSFVHYQALTAINPENAEGYFGMANVRTLQEDYDAAMIYARKALELYESKQAPQTGNAQYLVGVLHYYRQEDIEARKYLRIAKKNGVELEKHLEEFISTDDSGRIVLDTPDDYKKYEKEFIRRYNALLENPAEENTTERLKSCQFILDWVSGCPYVTVSITDKLVPYMTYGESLIIFMGGWAKFCIESGGCDEKWKGCVAGTEAVIEYYEVNKEELGKNKEIEKMIKRRKKNKLEKYIRENLKES